jgi:hypothetical protein
MTLFGIKLGDVVKVVLEFFGAKRRERQALEAAEERGQERVQNKLREVETRNVQKAGEADNSMLPDDGSDGVRDPNNTF